MKTTLLSSSHLWPLLEKLVVLSQSYTHELARVLKVSAPHVNRLCNQLEKLGVLKSSKVQNKKMYQLNYESTLTRELLRFHTVLKAQQSKPLALLSKKCRWGIFGSFSQGRQEKESDLDIWVMADQKQAAELRPILNQVEEEWEREVNVIYLNKKKLESLSEKDREFFLRLKIQSITEWEDIFE